MVDFVNLKQIRNNVYCLIKYGDVNLYYLKRDGNETYKLKYNGVTSLIDDNELREFINSIILGEKLSLS